MVYSCALVCHLRTTTFCRTSQQILISRVQNQSVSDSAMFRRQLSSAVAAVSSRLKSDYDLCTLSVRSRDIDSFLCSLFLPSTIRHHFIVLKALNLEIASIAPARSASSHPASMKFHFWRDLVDSCFANSPIQHPIARALHHSIYTLSLSRSYFDRMLHHRENDLKSKQPESLSALENYGIGTHGAILSLGLESLGYQKKELIDTANHFGQALSLAILLRGTRHHAECGRVYLPLTLTSKYGLTSESLLRLQETDPLKEVTFRIADLARAHWDEGVRAANESADKHQRKIFLQAAPTRIILDRLQDVQFNPLHAKLMRDSRFSLSSYLVQCSVQGKIL
ncbi:mitochondrial Complex I CI assembly protein NDUFAF6/C8orf38 [Andalucia godoyi]|uniref:15-cis-phytoene synthase n=1 Tax=Andalucia godoyi TaxID=505711 RepID=A0A8K0F279_ANDGO|nr:mitochondrial Complex I CI assembly protein NDUFAF6/C8orf38 [Andalucia godoyi]|eukprot:ANDGO_08780.mRNA.1 mitochondrial Complex I CI assembly protein NDUFAF6/C8orf38